MKKSTIKLLAMALVAITLVASVFTIVNASSTPAKATDVSAYTMFQNASDSTGASGTANKIIGSLITVIQIIGVGVAIIMLVVGIYLLYFVYSKLASFFAQTITLMNGKAMYFIFDIFFLIFICFLYVKDLKKDLQSLKKNYNWASFFKSGKSYKKSW